VSSVARYAVLLIVWNQQEISVPRSTLVFEMILFLIGGRIWTTCIAPDNTIDLTIKNNAFQAVTTKTRCAETLVLRTVKISKKWKWLFVPLFVRKKTCRSSKKNNVCWDVIYSRHNCLSIHSSPKRDVPRWRGQDSRFRRPATRRDSNEGNIEAGSAECWRLAFGLG